MTRSKVVFVAAACFVALGSAGANAKSAAPGNKNAAARCARDLLTSGRSAGGVLKQCLAGLNLADTAQALETLRLDNRLPASVQTAVFNAAEVVRIVQAAKGKGADSDENAPDAGSPGREGGSGYHIRGD